MHNNVHNDDPAAAQAVRMEDGASNPEAANPAAANPAAANPTAPAATPEASPSRADETPDVSSITQGMAEAQAVEQEVDEPEAQHLDEKASDEVLDKTPVGDALHSVKVDRFDHPELQLTPALLKGLNEMGFVRPSKIQAISLPKIWAGRNLIAQSHNGTGKTACFALGMLMKCDGATKKPQALCLCPTRELAQQISDEVCKIGKYHLPEHGLSIKTVLSDLASGSKVKIPKIEDQIIIGTPGKIKTLIEKHVIETKAIRVFVCDEADQMLSEGQFGSMTKTIRSKWVPKQAQTLFFSATWTDQVIQFAKTLGKMQQGGQDAWAQVQVKREYIFNDQTRQLHYRCAGKKAKQERLAEILTHVPIGQCIVFVHTRDAVDALTRVVTAAGHKVSALHGRMEAKARDKVLADFREMASRILITTNVLARGVDVPNITLVIQYDLPVMKGGVYDPETYLHRVGRTGRMGGRKGVALALIHDEKELGILKQIETYYQREGLVREVPQDTDPEAFEKLLVIE